MAVGSTCAWIDRWVSDDLCVCVKAAAPAAAWEFEPPTLDRARRPSLTRRSPNPDNPQTHPVVRDHGPNPTPFPAQVPCALCTPGDYAGVASSRAAAATKALAAAKLTGTQQPQPAAAALPAAQAAPAITSCTPDAAAADILASPHAPAAAGGLLPIHVAAAEGDSEVRALRCRHHPASFSIIPDSCLCLGHMLALGPRDGSAHPSGARSPV